VDFTLYRVVGAAKRIALGDLVTSEFYAADKDADGTIHLKPVNIVDGARAKRTDNVQGDLLEDDED
jgi:hypothetical protein